ncbi:unnamed protein product (macronuclear) [Paramecium tetraurelia]|uniref:HSF-type DNA-binding domain-containing protein n=1 Tax=Paramecium tetraurelia TaxID=5888 RepID=A0CTJ7_PARTE|nr:uncharacterized protein GSPATT00010348001 [Paramecium tetraurelia]CAK74114.1 unnamed protein product [Paramecium tetraurelia]|eukprot:XP_001441511.1 hypothetical protein (macronuclear) [Paramecium tetraurelia strain d4-2]
MYKIPRFNLIYQSINILQSNLYVNQNIFIIILIKLFRNDEKQKEIQWNQIHRSNPQNITSKNQYHLDQEKQYKDAITWDDEGNNIIIIDKYFLEQIVLPKYFKHAKYSSFLRQLNLYGFTSSKDQNGYLNYHHKNFARDKCDKDSIQKKLQIKDIQKSLGIFQSVQTELQSQLLTLQLEQNRIKQSLLNSIDQQLQIRCSIKTFLEVNTSFIIEQTIRFIRLEKENQFDQFIKGIQTIFQGLNPTACIKFEFKIDHYFQHLINLVFQQFNFEEVQSNQYLSEMDEQSNSYMISPYPLGLLELRANLSSRNEICFNNQALTLDT